MENNLVVTKIPLGPLQCNCYLIENGKEALLVDPGAELDKVKNLIKNKNVVGILLTHHHFDHVGCVEDLVKEYQYQVYDKDNLMEGKKQIGSFTFEVIYTLGHTMDSITYYFREDKIMFTGDFLFLGTIGRCDFLESDYHEMEKSIEKIKKYADDILIYPGHGAETNLGREKKENPYFR